jgi:hypothetical protein
VEERFALYEIGESDQGSIEIEFVHLPPDDKHNFAGWTMIQMNSGHSGNGLFPGCAIEIIERFGKFFGVECDPS